MDCVEDCRYDNLSLSRVMARIFSLKKHSSQYVGNVDIYSVGRDLVYQIWQIGKTECFAGISQEGLTHKTVMKTNCTICHDSSHSSHVLSTYFTSQKGFSRATRKNIFDLQGVLSLHTLSHTQPLQWNPTKIQDTKDWTKLQSNLAWN